jgi:hypothetical protein
MVKTWVQDDQLSLTLRSSSREESDRSGRELIDGRTSGLLEMATKVARAHNCRISYSEVEQVELLASGHLAFCLI